MRWCWQRHFVSHFNQIYGVKRFHGHFSYVLCPVHDTALFLSIVRAWGGPRPEKAAVGCYRAGRNARATEPRERRVSAHSGDAPSAGQRSWHSYDGKASWRHYSLDCNAFMDGLALTHQRDGPSFSAVVARPKGARASDDGSEGMMDNCMPAGIAQI